MPVAAEAILTDEQGRAVLRFERELRQAPERVWAALTEVSDLRRWHPSPFELEPRAGGRVHFLPPEGDAFGDGVVTAYEPPRVLAYTWGEDELRFELSPERDGTRLVLTHTFEDRLKAARDAAGWDLCLAALLAALEGSGQPEAPDAPDEARVLADGWSELNQAYERRFGIDPADATPPPTPLAAKDGFAPLLMFTGEAEQAMRFYASVFFPARIERIDRYAEGDDGGATGTVKRATMRIGGQAVQFIDSPPVHSFTFTPSVSLAVRAATADAVNAIFARLADGGTVLMALDRYPFSGRFGWVTDRFGVSWQVTVG